MKLTFSKITQWLYAFYGRLASAVLGMVVVYFYPEGQDISMMYFCIIMASTILSSFMSTVQFVSISAFMTSVADPLIGGTYMTVSFSFLCGCGETDFLL